MAQNSIKGGGILGQNVSKKIKMGWTIQNTDLIIIGIVKKMTPEKISLEMHKFRTSQYIGNNKSEGKGEAFFGGIYDSLCSAVDIFTMNNI